MELIGVAGDFGQLLLTLLVFDNAIKTDRA
jgi:hypothetical protein